jgi:NADPH:quinone reductase-like Zn-dependent oxidoreductase
MKAVRYQAYGNADVLSYQEIERPSPGAGEVLLKVAGAGFNPIDTWIRAGQLTEIFPVTLPHTPGIDVAGRVAELGTGVESLKLHEAVFGFLPIPGGGAMADFAIAPAAALAKAPASVPLADAASIPVAALTAWQGLFEQAKIKPGARVLINGAGGGVGGFAVQLAKRTGAVVIATASPRSAGVVGSYDPDQVIDYTSTAIADAIDGHVDVVFNLVVISGPQFEDLIRLTGPGGVVVTATSPQATSSEVEVAFFQVRSDTAQLAEIAGLVDAGELRLDISERALLTDTAAIHQRAEAGDLRGRVVLIPEG